MSNTERISKMHVQLAAIEAKIALLEGNQGQLQCQAPVEKKVHDAAPVVVVEPVAVPPQTQAEKKPKQNNAGGKKGGAPKVGADAGAVFDVSTVQYTHESFLPAIPPPRPETGSYVNNNTNTEEAIKNSFTDNERRIRTLCQEFGLSSSVLYRAPSDYYDWTLEQRRALLNAPSIHYLCKSMVMTNSKCPHDNYSNPADSKYYLVVIQYTARLHNERLGLAIRNLSNPPPSRKNFNFRWVDPEINDELTGYSHNGVTPIGTKNKIPIVLSDRIAKLENGFLWLGAGEVDLKWRVSVADFIAHFNPIIADITYDGAAEE